MCRNAVSCAAKAAGVGDASAAALGAAVNGLDGAAAGPVHAARIRAVRLHAAALRFTVRIGEVYGRDPRGSPFFDRYALLTRRLLMR